MPCNKVNTAIINFSSKNLKTIHRQLHLYEVLRISSDLLIVQYFPVISFHAQYFKDG